MNTSLPDPAVTTIIKKETKRQLDCIDLIPSENHTSPEVRKAVGSVLMHKYAEGYPGKRYYQGNIQADAIENLCRDRALETFKLDPAEWGVNVQAHSGSPANMAIYNALLEPGATMMAMYLPDGGHLSHGWEFKGFRTLVRKIWPAVHYHVDPQTFQFDYEQIRQQALAEKPTMLISGGTAYTREIDHAKMAAIAAEVGAFYFADVSHEGGIIAAGEHNSPFLHADVVMMTTHKTLRGPRGALIFARHQAKNRPAEERDLIAIIDKSVMPGMQGGPHLHSIAGIAVALREAQQPQFKKYIKQVKKNAQVLAKELIKHGYTVASGGVEKHLVLLDLRGTAVTAWIAAWALEYAGIVLNYNTVPNETGAPLFPSGMRLGSPIVTTRGMKEPEMKQIAAWIAQVMEYSQQWTIPTDKVERKAWLKKFKTEILPADKYLKKLRKEVTVFARQFPAFTWE
jgi:glycine hydroxymethyltransferase